MKENNEKRINFIFAQVPLWITYSGLPQKLGMSGWCVYRRLLELRYRFSSNNFYYTLEKLCKTTGAIDKSGLKKILKKLEKEGLVNYKTSQGRGMATEFKVIEPINAPLSEEDVYNLHPRLRSLSYKKQLVNEGKKVVNDTLLEGKKVVNDTLLEGKKVVNDTLLEGKKVVNDTLLEGKKVVNDTPNKKDIYKKDNNNNKKDLSHDEKLIYNKDNSRESETHHNVVVALNEKNLKEYGLSGEQVDKYLRKYSFDYLKEKIEIIEYKLFCKEEIRNIGALLKKAIEEDWQPPNGFTTRKQREVTEKKKIEEKEAEIKKIKKEEEKQTQEKEEKKAVEKWKTTALPEILKEIKERARREVLKENKGTDERFLNIPICLRENRIIVEEYLREYSIKGRGG